MSTTAELSPEADAFVKAVGAAADLPAFVRNVRSIGSVAANLDARVGLLEHAIMQDVALSAKVLRIANAAAGGGNAHSTVGSVKQAIMLLGFDRVQHLSTAASVFGQLEQDAPSVRDLLVESVLAANHSLQLSFAAGYDRPELAYLCALFRRFGELLVACYRPRAYRTWLEHVQAGGPCADGAEATQFGFTFEDVGVALAKRWGMPPAVVRTMRVYLGMSLGEETLHAVTQCSAELARCLYGAAATTDDAEVREIRTRFAPLIGIDVLTMQECMIVAINEAKPTLHTMQVDLDVWLRGHADATAVALVKRDSTHGTTAEQEQGADMLAPADAAALQEAIDRLVPNPSDSAQEARLRDVVRALVQQREQAQGSFSVGSVTDSTLRAACEAGYERGVLGISAEDFKLIRGRVGIGRGSAELARNFLLRPTAAFGPLGAALHIRRDLFVEMTGGDARLYGRDRLIKELSPSNFALLPLVLEMKLIGCLYFDSTIESVHSTETSRRLLCDLRDHLVAAFAHHRSSIAEPAEGAA
ncbi:HDOD domain-containing protein [Gemmatimonas sp.]|uniref:HDOD domain-containing protein n=1 Tax=Gemmatimonas sp. TaxID=1962908 RepID=UPI00286E6BFD|nr:HDOD domain-containing protein [Gemmatimonas sp.]